MEKEERRALRVLHRTTDMNEIVDILEQVMSRNCTLQTLWEYRKWFRMLSQEQLCERYSLAVGMIQICIMAGEVEYMRELIQILPEHRIGRYLKTLTAGHPSAISGILDFTPHMDKLDEKREISLEILRRKYPDNAESIYDLMLAEFFYQQDRCYDALRRQSDLDGSRYAERQAYRPASNHGSSD